MQRLDENRAKLKNVSFSTTHYILISHLSMLLLKYLVDKLNTASLWDEYKDLRNCVDLISNHFSKKKVLHNKITTLELFEDNFLLKKQLKSESTGKVLVVDVAALYLVYY